MKIKLMLLPQSTYCSEGVANVYVMMIMVWWCDDDDDDDEDHDHDDCKCGATSGLGRTCLGRQGSQKERPPGAKDRVELGAAGIQQIHHQLQRAAGRCHQWAKNLRWPPVKNMGNWAVAKFRQETNKSINNYINKHDHENNKTYIYIYIVYIYMFSLSIYIYCICIHIYNIRVYIYIYITYAYLYAQRAHTHVYLLRLS